MTTETTTTPFRFGNDQPWTAGDSIIAIEAGESLGPTEIMAPILDEHGDPLCWVPDDAAGAFLLRACNCHNKLVASVSELSFMLAEADAEDKAADHYGDDSCSYCDAVARAQAILAKATP